jgi:hypothetical protein
MLLDQGSHSPTSASWWWLSTSPQALDSLASTAEDDIGSLPLGVMAPLQVYFIRQLCRDFAASNGVRALDQAHLPHILNEELS